MNSEVTLEQLRGLSDKATPGEFKAIPATDLHGYDAFLMCERGALGYAPKDTEKRDTTCLFTLGDARFIAACVNEIRRQLTTPPASGEVVGVPNFAGILGALITLRRLAEYNGDHGVVKDSAMLRDQLEAWLSAAPKQAMGWRPIATDAMVAAYLKEYQAEFEAAYERLLTNPEERSPIQDACRKGIAAALAASPSGWLDIAIAPKDGTAVLCYWPGCIMNGRDYAEQVGIAITAHSGQWFDADGSEFGEPTHWQPLPSPPEKAGG